MKSVASLAARDFGLFINGEFVASSQGSRELINPATGELFATVAEAGATEVDAATKTAREAAIVWGRTAPRERAETLEAIADVAHENREDLAEIDSLNTGRPISETRFDMEDVEGIFRFYARATTHLQGETVTLPGGVLGFTLREPRGVVGLIAPWNYPLATASVKLAAALAAGNTCVLKPSELTPISALRFVDLLTREGCLSPGVVNVVCGDGPATGGALVDHPGIDMVSFTGGTDTGRAILSRAAAGLKPVTLELGGKSPNIVFGDAEFDLALDAAVLGAFSAHGQNCVAGTRLLLQTGIYEPFVEAFCERASAIRLGEPMAPETEMGPLVSAEQRERVEGYVKIGVAEGAKLVLGGKRPDDPAFDKGFFFEPTVFAPVDNNMRIAQEEIFGPVVAAIPFTTADEAISLANGTRYGLAAAIWTKDLDQAFLCARAIRAGMVWINDYNAFYHELPYGGYGESGFGREMGIPGLHEFTVLKQITVKVKADGRK